MAETYDVAEIPHSGEQHKLLCGELGAVVRHHFLRDAVSCEDGFYLVDYCRVSCGGHAFL